MGRVLNTARDGIDLLNNCVRSRRMSKSELEKWARAFPEDRLFMGHVVVARLQVDEVVELIRLIERLEDGDAVAE